MKNLAIILDSFAGRDKKSLEKDNYYYLPHLVYIDNKEYIDGVTISTDDIIKYDQENKKLSSSMPAPKSIINIYNKITKLKKDGLYLPMGSAISGTYQSAYLLSKDYNNIYVIDNHITGTKMYELAIEKAQNMYAANKSMDEIISKLNKWNEKIFNLIIPVNLNALVRSGRIGRTKAMFLNKAKIIPIIKYTSQLKVKWVKRTQKRAIIKAIHVIKHYISALEEEYDVHITYAGLKPILDEPIKMIKQILNIDSKHIYTSKCNAVVIVHLGYRAICISAAPRKI